MKLLSQKDLMKYKKKIDLQVICRMILRFTEVIIKHQISDIK